MAKGRDGLFDDVHERGRRIFCYRSDIATMVEKEYNSPGKQNITSYINMKVSTMTKENVKGIKY